MAAIARAAGSRGFTVDDSQYVPGKPKTAALETYTNGMPDSTAPEKSEDGDDMFLSITRGSSPSSVTPS